MPGIASWFSTRESRGGQPDWLFTLGQAGRVWRLTSSNRPVTVALTGVTYEPALIGRDRIERSSEVRASAITVRVGRTTPLADTLRDASSHAMMIRIDKYHRGDPASRPIVEAEGSVGNVRLTGGWVMFDVVLPDQRFEQRFPAMLIERQSQWPAFSPESGINENDYSFTTTVTSIVGRTITVAATGFAYAGYYNSGQMKFGFDTRADRLFVDYHDATAFHVVGDIPTSVLAAYAAFLAGGPAPSVTLIAGNDRTLKTTRDKFGAVAVNRFVGFDLLPTTDPLQTGVTDAPVNVLPYGTPGSPTLPSAPAPSTGLPLRLYPTLAETDPISGGDPGSGTVTFTLNDPNARFVNLETRSNPTGFAAGETDWSDVPLIGSDPTVYEATAAKGVGGYVEMQFRLTYLDDAMTEQTALSSWTFTRPFYLPAHIGPNIDDPTEIIVTQFGVDGGSTWLRAFLALTADQNLRVDIPYRGQRVRLHIDASGGPYTIHLPTADLGGTPLTNRLPGGAVITSLVVTGYAVLEIEKLYDDNLLWTVIA